MLEPVVKCRCRTCKSTPQGFLEVTQRTLEDHASADRVYYSLCFQSLLAKHPVPPTASSPRHSPVGTPRPQPDPSSRDNDDNNGATFDYDGAEWDPECDRLFPERDESNRSGDDEPDERRPLVRQGEDTDDEDAAVAQQRDNALNKEVEDRMHLDPRRDRESSQSPEAPDRDRSKSHSPLPEAPRPRPHPVLRPYDAANRERHPLAPSFGPDNDDVPLCTPGPAASTCPPLERLIYLLVEMARHHFQLRRQGASFLLLGLRLVLRCVGSEVRSYLERCAVDQEELVAFCDTLGDSIAKDPATSTKKLGLSSNILSYPCCPSSACAYVYPPTSTSDLPRFCTQCSEPLTETVRRNGENEPRVRKAIPVQPLRSWVQSLLLRPGLEPLLKARPLDYRSTEDPVVVMSDIWDGESASTFPGRDDTGSGDQEPSSRFFDAERRLSFTIYIDWIDITSQVGAASYKVGFVFALCNNLPPTLRYKLENAGLLAVLPGPKEVGMAVLNQIQRIFVEEMKDFWEGVSLASPASDDEGGGGEQEDPPNIEPASQDSRAKWYGVLHVLLGDRPAAAKMSGASGHNHTSFCSLDNASLATTNDVIRERQRRTLLFDLDKLKLRDGNEYHERLQERKHLSPEEQNVFTARHGLSESPWDELPYVDFVKTTVVDPMHVLYLGLAKWQQVKIGLDAQLLVNEPLSLPRLHTILARFVTPSDIGRLPEEFGLPSGGSLKADQWRAWQEILGPVALYILYFVDADEQERAKLNAGTKKRKRNPNAATEETETGSKRGRAHFKKRWKGQMSDDSFARNARRADYENFVKLSMGCRLLSTRSTTLARAQQGISYISEYCRTLVRLYGSSSIAPNHHFALHLFDSVRLFGPLFAWWAFSGERFNGIVGRTSTNNKSSELEETMMRNLIRLAALDSTRLYSTGVSQLTDYEIELLDQSSRIRSDRRGTYNSDVASLAHRNRLLRNAGIPVHRFEGRMSSSSLILNEYASLLSWFKRRDNEDQRYKSYLEPAPDNAPFRSITVDSAVLSFDHVTIDGLRFATSKSRQPNSRHDDSCVVFDCIDDVRGITTEVGKIRFLFEHMTFEPGSGIVSRAFALIDIYNNAQCVSPWAAFPDLDTYIRDPTFAPLSSSSVVPLSSIKSKAAYVSFKLGGRDVLAFVDCDRRGPK